MNVAELRAALADLPDDVIVVMSKDGEGNGYSPCAEVATGNRYIAETTWMGELADEDEEPDAGEPCIVLWPTN